MELLYTNASVSISELKKNPTAVIDEADGFPVAVLNHNRPAAYLVPAERFSQVNGKPFKVSTVLDAIRERTSGNGKGGAA